MTEKNITYIVPDSAILPELSGWLRRSLGMTEEREGITCLRYVDTQDWRIYRHNAVLEEQSDPDSVRLRLSTLYKRKLLALQIIRNTPHYCFELAPGLLRKRLDLMVDTLPLEIKARALCRITAYALRNEDDKIVLRAQIEQNTALDENNKAYPLGCRFRLIAVKGYEPAYKDTCQRIAKELGLAYVHEDLLLASLLATAPDRTTGRISPMHRNLTAATQVKNRLVIWLQTIEKHERGVRAGRDPEHLHDIRVAVRRTRTAILQLRGCFPKSRLKPYAQKFREVARTSSEARDLDVQIEKLKKRRKQLPPTQRLLVTPIVKLLQVDRIKARRSLLKKLASSNYQKLLKGWYDFLQSGELEASLSTGVPRTLEQVATDSIGRAFDRALREARALDSELEPEDLHELRKTLKKLRYGLELFESLYKTHLKSMMPPLKRLQESLGHIQDLRMEQILLERVERRLSAQARGISAAQTQGFSSLRKIIDAEMADRKQGLSTQIMSFISRESRECYARLDHWSEVETENTAT